MSSIVFLDTETTGLNPEVHEVWEVAWALEAGPISSIFLPHEICSADPTALKLNGYYDRFDPARIIPQDELYLREVLDKATIVASNPSFDTSFLRARWHVEPWNHRKIDIAAYAMPALGLERPVGLAKIAEHFGIEAPDHTAAGDVSVLRQCWEALRAHYAGVAR